MLRIYKDASAWVEDVPNFLDQYILAYAIHSNRVKVKHMIMIYEEKF